MDSSFTLPTMVYVFGEIYLKFGYKAAGGKFASVEFAMNIMNEYMHAFFLVLIVGSKATPATTFLMEGLDFLIHLQMCIKVIRFHQAGGPMGNAKKEEILMALVLAETVELLVPLAYCTSLLISFYGPNSEIIGNVGNRYWHYEKIDDVWEVISQVAQFFFYDLLSVAFSGLLLWKFCRINFIQVYCKMVNEFWFLLSISLATVLNIVCYYSILRSLF